jgi:5-methyltetrahydrofolate--homocysteine methyltransferase
VHVEYLEAGSDLIQTNTFSSTSIAQADYGLSSLAYEMNVTAARLAKGAAETWSARTPRQPRFVAGTIGPTNRFLSPTARPMPARIPDITFDQLKDAYTEQARGLIDGGCDLLLVETVFDATSAAAALAAIDAASLACARRLPIMVSATVSAADGRNLAGQTIETFWTTIRQSRPFSAGLNCSSGARAIRPHLEALARVADCFVSCHPSAGLPDASGQYPDRPADFADILRGFASSRLVNIVGGCCGTTPDHINAIVEAVRDMPPRAATDRQP